MHVGRIYRPDDQNLRVDPRALPREVEVTEEPVINDVNEGDTLAVLMTGTDGESYVLVGTFEIRREGTYPSDGGYAGDSKVSYWVVRKD